MAMSIVDADALLRKIYTFQADILSHSTLCHSLDQATAQKKHARIQIAKWTTNLVPKPIKHSNVIYLCL